MKMNHFWYKFFPLSLNKGYYCLLEQNIQIFYFQLVIKAIFLDELKQKLK